MIFAKSKARLKTIAVIWTVLVIICAYLIRSYFITLWLADINQQQELPKLQAINLISNTLSKYEDISEALYHNLSFQRSISVGRDIDTEQLKQVFSIFSRVSPSIAQIRWLNDQGMEVVRVNQKHNGDISITEAHLLQNKNNRDYVQEAKAIPHGQVYLSDIDLNKEFGNIVTPYQPTQRAVIRTSTAQQLTQGFLIINFDLTELFNKLKQYQDAAMSLQVLNEKGFWLLHPNADKTWGAVLEHGSNITQQSPQLWQQVTTSYTGSMLQYQNRIWSYYRLRSHPVITVLITTPESLVAETMWRINLYTLAAAVLMLILGNLIVWQLLRLTDKARILRDKLTNEKQQLAQRNKELQTALYRQQTLQDSLVESRRLSALGMTVAGVAHQLNTPSSGVALAVSTMEQQLTKLEKEMAEGPIPEPLQRFITLNQKGLELASLNLDKLKEQLISFKRLASERSSTKIAEISLFRLLNDINVVLTPRLKMHNIQIQINVDEGLNITTDSGLLSQVLQNLLDNAIEHAFGQGGNRLIQVNAIAEAHQVRIDVKDNGQGISPALKDSVFAPFVTSAHGSGNTGLGLHLVHQWVTQQLQGQIELESIPGKGCRFTLILPLIISNTTEQSPASPPSIQPDAVS